MKQDQAPDGTTYDLDGETFYRIGDVDRLPSFLISIPSDTDLYMFVTSLGGLTAGRVSADGALFPYVTEDRLQDSHFHTGPITIVRVEQADGGAMIWEPFGACPSRTPVRRNLYKNSLGNRLVFEEIAPALGLTFRARWAACNEYGWVRTCDLVNSGDRSVRATVLDGLRNVLPFGAPLALYQKSSSLIDAYKRTDLDEEARLAVFSLTATITDRAEAAESLRANVAWSIGPAGSNGGDAARPIALSATAVEQFRSSGRIATEHVLTGRRGNYLCMFDVSPEPGDATRWHVIADAGLDHVAVADLRARVLSGEADAGSVEAALDRASENVRKNVASADGLQLTADPIADGHHFANVLFNNMRGGVFADGYSVDAEDFAAFVSSRNRAVWNRQRDFASSTGDRPRAFDLVRAAEATGDSDLLRLTYEYLPLYFGRRHGDPSRPWNRFSIRVQNPDGSRVLRYEGNWRDIFQNWEALMASFPDFLPHMIAKFVNASTIDGFNPYRVATEGIDWEIDDPEDPWSYIGYWGDHQIIYLLKFLEALPRYSPGVLEEMLRQEIFSYANVPYRIRSYDEILANPNDTIVFDTPLADVIEARVADNGADGRLLPAADGSVYHVTLLEKLLVPALSKLSNFVPDGGIWMNTQRPEWNDANNALAGNGLSMVTLGYLRRYLSWLRDLLDGVEREPFRVSREVVDWMAAVRDALAAHVDAADGAGDAGASGRARRALMNALGNAFSDYRTRVYANGFSGRSDVSASDVREFCTIALARLDDSLASARREDGLYDAYNILSLPDDERALVAPLYEMLEGQVAALSSGRIGAEEAVRIVDALYASDMYRADQHSFLLYPARSLPAFRDRNVVPGKRARAVALLALLEERGDRRIVGRGADGVLRFHADFQNADALAAALDTLEREAPFAKAVERDRAAVLELYEEVFAHHSYTGRSGTMYGYEGIGSIYWHMVAKLLHAVQETLLRAKKAGEAPKAVNALADRYYRIRSGLGFRKTPAEYGAFTVDPYSHTPAHSGARQPGMTGQVKEEILTRFGELGVVVENGTIRFRPLLLKREEFRVTAGAFPYLDVNGNACSFELPPGTLAFTLCQVPVVYHACAGPAAVRVTDARGDYRSLSGDGLDASLSRSVFGRRGDVARIEVDVPIESLFENRD